jgi:hypothetical protein
MRLILEVPGTSSSVLEDALYIKVKELTASLDIAGVFSLLKLQANLIIAIYEMGHGIFPTAYISMGSCVTQAMALGIHDRNAPQILEQPRTWVEWEERQRVWWLIVILDRYLPRNVFFHILRLMSTPGISHQSESTDHCYRQILNQLRIYLLMTPLGTLVYVETQIVERPTNEADHDEGICASRTIDPLLP